MKNADIVVSPTRNPFCEKIENDALRIAKRYATTRAAVASKVHLQGMQWIAIARRAIPDIIAPMVYEV